MELVDTSIKTLPVEGNTCALHSYHSPVPTYFEVHHVVPNSWWDFYPDALRTYVKPTAVLCRTGHGNVHFVLVQLTRLMALEHFSLPGAWYELNLRTPTHYMARWGIKMAQDAGMDIITLYNAGLRGQI